MLRGVEQLGMQQPQTGQSRRSAVIFDLDGTLTKPDLDFDVIRAEIGVEGPILEAMEAMAPEQRTRAESILLRYEHDAADRAELYDGAVDVVRQIREAGFSAAILTRNRRANVDAILGRFGIEVDAMRTRDDGAIKPSPEPILALCRELGADPRDSWMVGDYLFDIQSGRAAGATTVLMIGDRERPDFADQADHTIRRLVDLLPIVGVSSTHA